MVVGVVSFEFVYIKPMEDHRRAYHRIENSVEELAHRRPSNVTREQWSYIIGWTAASDHPFADLQSAAPVTDAKLELPFAINLFDQPTQRRLHSFYIFAPGIWVPAAENHGLRTHFVGKKRRYKRPLERVEADVLDIIDREKKALRDRGKRQKADEL